MVKAQKQHRKHLTYDWLKAYSFSKGKSGNPGGRPKGAKSVKTYAREFLESLSEEEKIKFISTLPSELVWRMAEGNPDTKSDVTTDGQPINVVITKYGDKPAV